MNSKILPGKEPTLKGKTIIPVCAPLLKGNESKYLNECLTSNWISSAGQFIKKFEESFSKACGAKYGVACSSGTTALHLALISLDIGSGDEVIIPTFTMISTALAVYYSGAKIVLVDADPTSWNIDCEQIESKITEKTRAIIPVHTYGHPAEMDRMMEIARKHDLNIIEDAAEAHGAEYKGEKAGTMGVIGIFSFFANKIITTGEGGMLITDNRDIAERAAKLRNFCFSDDRHFYHHTIGFNYKLTNMQAAIGVAQVERFNELIKARIRNANIYQSWLKDVSGITLMPENDHTKNAYWMYSIIVQDTCGLTRDQLREYLADHGIETRSFFIPMHLQPVFSTFFQGEKYPTAEELCYRGMYLPSSPGLTEAEIEFISKTIKKAVGDD